MLVDKTGQPIASEGNDMRYIKIVETMHEGKKVWAVDYHPHVSNFEFEEVFQVLGNVIAGVAQNARARKYEALKQQALQAELNKEK